MKCSRCGVDRPALVWTDPEPWLCAACTAEIRKIRRRDAQLAANAGSGGPPWLEDGEDAVSVGEGTTRSQRFREVAARFGERLALSHALREAGYAPEEIRQLLDDNRFLEAKAPQDGDTKVADWTTRLLEIQRQEAAKAQAIHGRRIENPSPDGQAVGPGPGGGEPKGSPLPLNCDCGAARVRGETHAAWCATRRRS